MLHLRATSLAHTHAIAAALAGVVRAGDTVVLAGEMGAGKTAFAQGFGRALGVTEPITSPTFTLVHSYTGSDRAGRRISVHHADLYRLSTLHEVDDLGLAELVDGNSVLLVEWGDVAASVLGEHLLVRLDHVNDDEGARDVSVSAVGPTWASRWHRVEAALAGVAPC